MRKFALAVMAVIVVLYIVGHLPTSVADQKSIQQQVATSGTTPIPAAALAPMVVNGPSYLRAGGVQRWSVICIPADTVPFEFDAAVHWREVEVSEQGPDGPDGYWKSGRPCPTGNLLAGG
jgi:hypothetical protein